MRKRAHLGLIVASIAFFATPSWPAENWKDISSVIREEIEQLARPKELDLRKERSFLDSAHTSSSAINIFPIFVDVQSVKSIQSVNHPGRTFKRADFSFYRYGSASKRRIVVDCKDWHYKEGDNEADWNWVPPADLVLRQGKVAEYAALNYLCQKPPSPWHLFAGSRGGTNYYYNLGAYGGNSTSYGQLKKLYVASSQHIDNELVFYASCSKKMSGLYAWEDDPGWRDAVLDSPLPLTVAEQMLNAVCGFPERAYKDSNAAENTLSEPELINVRSSSTQTLMERYRKAVEDQRRLMESLMGR